MTGWIPPPTDPYDEAYRRAAIAEFVRANPGPAPEPRPPSLTEEAREVRKPVSTVMRTAKLLGKLGSTVGDVQFDMGTAHELLRESDSGPSAGAWRNDENSPPFTQRMMPGDTSSNMDVSRAAHTAVSQAFDLDADGVDTSPTSTSKTGAWRRGYEMALCVAFGKRADVSADPLRAGTDALRRGDGSEDPPLPDPPVVANPNTRMSTSQVLRGFDNTPACDDSPPLEEPLP